MSLFWFGLFREETGFLKSALVDPSFVPVFLKLLTDFDTLKIFLNIAIERNERESPPGSVHIAPNQEHSNSSSLVRYYTIEIDRLKETAKK